MHSFCLPWLLALHVVCLCIRQHSHTSLVSCLGLGSPHCDLQISALSTLVRATCSSCSFLGLGSLHHDLQISTPSTLARAACSPHWHWPGCTPWSSLPARLQLCFALCFVFRSTLQMLISLLSTSLDKGSLFLSCR